jgi:hypothetical protein
MNGVLTSRIEVSVQYVHSLNSISQQQQLLRLHKRYESSYTSKTNIRWLSLATNFKRLQTCFDFGSLSDQDQAPVVPFLTKPNPSFPPPPPFLFSSQPTRLLPFLHDLLELVTGEELGAFLPELKLGELEFASIPERPNGFHFGDGPSSSSLSVDWDIVPFLVSPSGTDARLVNAGKIRGFWESGVLCFFERGDMGPDLGRRNKGMEVTEGEVALGLGERGKRGEGDSVKGEGGASVGEDKSLRRGERTGSPGGEPEGGVEWKVKS